MVSRKTSEQVAKEMTYIALKVWERYLKVKNIFFNYDEIMKNCDDFIAKEKDSLFENTDIRLLNFTGIDPSALKSLDEQKEAFKNFLKFWVTTVFLAI